MAKELPYFRWYPADAEIDTQYASMDWLELGLYHRCLNLSWMNGGVPSDLDELADALKVSRKKLERPWVKVGRRFTASESNPKMLVDARQEKERVYATSKSERNTNAVRTRYERSTNVVYGDVVQRASESESGSDSPSEVPSLREVLPFILPKPSYALDEPFMMFMAEVALTGTPLIDADYIDAHSVWASMDMPERMLAISNFREKREFQLFSDPAMVMRPAKWLKRKEFNRRAVKARDSPTDRQKEAKKDPYVFTPIEDLGWDGKVDGM